ncbi:MAG TPA: hypothetical protein VMM55_10540, partial [Thermohalobaculum sp.]|nr:hypothetical protein [Thermohalobaculum sp.]
EAGPEARLARFARFEDMVALLVERREMKLAVEVERHVRLVTYRPGVLEFSPAPGAAPDLAGRLSERLHALTGARWSVAVTSEEGAPTLAETRARDRAALAAEAAGHPLVAAALAAFPGARVEDVRPLHAGAPAGAPAEDEFLAPAPEADDIEPDGDLLDADDAFDPFEERL